MGAYRVVLRTVDTPCGTGAVWLGGWRIRDSGGALVSSHDGDAAEALPGHHVHGLCPTLEAALAYVPRGSAVHVAAEVDYFVAEMARSPAQREATFYMAGGKKKKPLAGRHDLEKLDAFLQGAGISLTASRLQSERDASDYAELTHRLELLKEYVGREPEWGY